MEAEVGDGSIEDFVFLSGDFDEVFVFAVDEGTNDGFALDGTDLFVEEFAVGGDGEFHEVAFNELGLRGVVRRDGVVFAVRADHDLAIKNAFDDFSFSSGDDGVAGGGNCFAIT